MAKKNEAKPVAKTTEAPVQNPEEITPENVYEKIDEQTTASLEAAKLAFDKMAEAKTKVEAEEIKEVVYQAQWVNLKSVCGMRKYRAYSKLMKEFADKTKEFAEKVSGDPAKNIAPSMNNKQYRTEIDNEYNEKVGQIRDTFRKLGVWSVEYDFDPSGNSRYDW